MRLIRNQWLLWAMILSFMFVSLTPPLHAAKKKKKVSINLPSSIDLVEFIKIIATETNTVFIYEEKNLRGKISITSPPNFKVSADDAFFLFEKLLLTQGLTMIRRQNSNVIEIIPAREARYQKLDITKDGQRIRDPQNEFVMRLIQIKHADLNKIKALLSPIFSKSGVMLTYKPLDLLIVLDNQLNVKRVEEIVKSLDVEEPDGIEQEVTLYTMKHNPVKDVHKTVSALFSNLTRNGKKASVKFIIETRLNSLIIVADTKLTAEIIDFLEKIDVPSNGTLLTVHELRYASVKQLSPLITKIYPATKGGAFQIIPFDNLNAIIIIATPSVTQNVIDLVKQLDVAKGDVQIKLHPLKFAQAKVMAPLLSKIFTDKIVSGKGKGKTAATSTVKIIAQTRLNSLIIIADALNTEKIISLVNEMDVPQDDIATDSNFKLYPLQYAVASKLAKLLKEVTGGIVAVSQKEETSKKRNVRQKNKRGSEISISADEATNSLLIFAPADTFATLDKIIAKLDVRRLQVYVEAMILDVKLDKSMELGINWTAASPAGKNTVVGAFPGGFIPTQENVISSASSHTIGVVGPELTIGEQTFFSFSSFIDATKSDSEFNILANPQLMMLNNEEASINVSTVIPVATNTVTDSSGRTTDQIEFRDIGIILSIKPQISGDDSIRLEIKQTASDISETSVGTTNAVTTFKRELKTSVVTGNGDIVVLGGLIDERVNKAESRIPGLGDLPLLGWLFSNSRNRFQKTNLLLFIRPRIIRNQEDLINATRRAKTRYHHANSTRKSTKSLLKELQPPNRLKGNNR